MLTLLQYLIIFAGGVFGTIGVEQQVNCFSFLQDLNQLYGFVLF
jgi:hypothetical protein